MVGQVDGEALISALLLIWLKKIKFQAKLMGTRTISP